MNDQHDLELVLNSHFPIITIETHEEHRALDLLKKAAASLKRELLQWTITEGLQALTVTNQLELAEKPTDEVQHELAKALRNIKERPGPGIYALLDIHDHIDDPVVIRLLKEIAQQQLIEDRILVFISHEIAMPEELSRFCAKFEMALPDKVKIKQLLMDEAKLWSMKSGSNVKADAKAMELLITNLVGLTVTDTKRFLRTAIHNDGAITHDDLPAIQKAKYELIGQNGLLSFEYDTAKFSEVGGMRKLKDWLDKRHGHFIKPDPDDVLDSPKGILLVGVQGGGKSLTAKAVAGVWGVPLLRLDFGVLYNKFFGETERNIRKALKLAEVMSPCVLWIDEIEKGIATGDNDNGTSKRLLGTLLTWMAENKQHVFIVATANDIQSLPPELIRKGRLDEIFFVDLPTTETRTEIFRIHLEKRKQNSRDFDLELLAQRSEGFAGAEIEQVIVGGCYSALADNAALNMHHLLTELANTKPLSVVMDNKIAALRQWAVTRTVPAD